MTDNLADTPAGREHPESRDAHGHRQLTAATALWFAVYLLTAVLSASGAVLVARAVHATGMETATAGGATFLAVLALAISTHRFLQGR